ncbi:MAG: flippase-like domain-containing protein [Alphaproteobacteria bacterium]|nr:flippase-like domain-containing protein [Alphaproteobacteria bacterium]
MSKKSLIYALKFALSAALVAYLLGKVDLAHSWERAKNVDALWLLGAAFLFLMQIVLGALRWRAVSRAISQELSVACMFRLYYISTFFGLVLPGAVGSDAVRIWMAHKSGLKLGGAINGVMLERIVTVLALLLLVVATQPFLLSRISDQGLGWIFPLMSLAAVAGIVLIMVLDRLPGHLDKWRLVRGLAQLAQDTRKLFLKPVHAFPVMFLAIFGHINYSLVVYALAQGLDINVSVIDCLVLVPPVMLVMTLPISIAGWGVRETAMVTAFAFIGVPAAASLVLSILLGLLGTAMSLPGGLVWFLSPDRQAARDAATAPIEEPSPDPDATR